MHFTFSFSNGKITCLRANGANYFEGIQIYSVSRPVVGSKRTKRNNFPVMSSSENPIYEGEFSGVLQYVNKENQAKLKGIEFLSFFENEPEAVAICYSFQELQAHIELLDNRKDLRNKLTRVVIGDIFGYITYWVSNKENGYYYQSISDDMKEHPLSLKMDLFELLKMIEE
jgi:hypothetical protein